MTFTVQEVPEWDICDISDEEFKMYDLTLPDILGGKEQCLTGVVPEEIKSEDPYQLSTSLMGSGDVHGLNESYNSFFLTTRSCSKSSVLIRFMFLFSRRKFILYRFANANTTPRNKS